MRKRLLIAGAVVLLAGTVAAQQPQTGTPLAVGTDAPAFTLPSVTSAGLGKPVSLADFKGQTVVLAFFFRARSPG